MKQISDRFSKFMGPQLTKSTHDLVILQFIKRNRRLSPSIANAD